MKAMDGNNSSVEGAFTVIVLNDLGSVFSVSGGSFQFSLLSVYRWKWAGSRL